MQKKDFGRKTAQFGKTLRRMPLASETRCKTLAIVAACLLLPSTSRATEVMVIRYKDRIVLAADSKQVHGKGPPTVVCKIEHSGQFWWVAAGVARNRDTGFDVAEVFAAVAKKGLDTRQTLEAIGRRIKGPLQKELPILRRRDPAFFAGGVPLMIIGARFSGDRAAVFLKKFKIVNGEIVPQPVTTCDQSVPMCRADAAPPEVHSYANNHPEIWTEEALENTDNVVTIVDRLMSIGISADPNDVGPPVSILSITKDGPKWLRQNNCEAIGP